MKALFISLCFFLCPLAFAGSTLSYEAAKAEMSARFQKQASDSLDRLRTGNFSDIDMEFKRFEELIDAGVSLESVGTTKEEIYDIHLKYPSKYARKNADTAFAGLFDYLGSNAFRREMRWGSDKLRAQKSLGRLRAGNPNRDFETELWDFEAFREAGNLSLAELGTSQNELKELHKSYSCKIANQLWRKKNEGNIKPKESKELLNLLKEFGPCPNKQ